MAEVIVSTPTVIEIVDQLQPTLDTSLRDDRTDAQRSGDRNALALAIQDGDLSSASLGGYTERTSHQVMLSDVWDAKERAYGIGSTNPEEIAEIYGWGGWRHQQAELSSKDRAQIMASQDLPPPPLDDPEYLRDLLHRYDIQGVTITDIPDVRYATEDETRKRPSAVAWAKENTRDGPMVRVNPYMAAQITREEIENAIAHEFVHTIMMPNTRHGPEFMRYVDERNIAPKAPDPLIRRLDISKGSGYSDNPRGGRVPVHGAQFEGLTDWVEAKYTLLAEPGERQSQPHAESPMVSGRAHLLPGSAVLREWPSDNTSPPYWEIGTVKDDGIIQWDCLTYQQPDQDALDEYVRLGYCPPELQKKQIFLSPMHRSDIQNYLQMMSYQTPIDSKMLLQQARWRDSNIKRVIEDPTLTHQERVDLLNYIGDIMTSVDDGYDVGDEDTQDVIKQRDTLVHLRDPALIAMIQSTQDTDEREHSRLVNTDRSIIAGSPPGLPYGASPKIEFGSAPPSDVSPWPHGDNQHTAMEKRLDTLKEDVDRYKDASQSTYDAPKYAIKGDSATTNPRHESRRGRGDRDHRKR